NTADEEGVAQALRDMESGSGVEAPTKVSSQVVPDQSGKGSATLASPSAPGGAAAANASSGSPSPSPSPAASASASASVAGAAAPGSGAPRSPRPSEARDPRRDARGSGGFPRFGFPEASAPPAAPGSQAVSEGSAPPPSRPIFSLSEIWPEADREGVKQ